MGGFPHALKLGLAPVDRASGVSDVKVDVCIVTYQRPQGLRRLLGSLQGLRFPDPAPDLRVVVVDNDPDESARTVCAEVSSWLGHPLLYVVEKRRGIPQARNAAVAVALDRAGLLAFIDDDEVPSRDWLAELLRVQKRHRADAVAGPCLPVFEAPAPAWIERGGFFERPRHPTGARIDYAFTHNVLVSTRALAAMDALFDERLALTGGSDAEFFRRFAGRNHRIVWADAAVVWEWVPPSRANLRWLLRRALRVGSSSALIDRARPRPASALHLLAHGGWCIVKGSVLLLWLRGRAPAVRALRLVCFGVGRLAGLVGIPCREYRGRDDR